MTRPERVFSAGASLLNCLLCTLDVPDRGAGYHYADSARSRSLPRGRQMRDDIRAMRSEAAVFAGLSALCRSEGYVRAISTLCFRDNIVRYSAEMRPKDIARLFSPDRLRRTEISTLAGLMIQGDISGADDRGA